jgi:hypothetical protein
LVGRRSRRRRRIVCERGQEDTGKPGNVRKKKGGLQGTIK